MKPTVATLTTVTLLAGIGAAEDNLCFVGGKVHSAGALPTSDGIITIDTLYPDDSAESMVGAARIRLGQQRDVGH